MRGRFADLVERQLELFAEENDDLLRDCDAALDAYNAAPAGEAEELYGDYLLCVEAAQDELVAYRDGFARTLDADSAAEYEAVFNGVARKRLPRLSLELD